MPGFNNISSGQFHEGGAALREPTHDRYAPIASPDALDAAGLASLIDHTLLKPGAGEKDVRRLCDEAVKWGFAAVCVNPARLALAAGLVRGTRVAPCAVIGFPLGASRADVKAYEAARAVEDGAEELDMVIPMARFATATRRVSPRTSARWSRRRQASS